ncbi:MAG: 50S ribosomal protein L18 [Acidianus sp.]|nr:50S ribosomal protein L18 [Acidianus sp.]
MKGGPNYKVPLRRRREGKTDYYKRFRLLLGGKTRMVVRVSNKYVAVQFIDFDFKGDKVVAAAHSRELIEKFGWKGSGKATCAAYLTGFLAALRFLEKGGREAILDVGLHKPSRGSRVFAALKGALDAGVNIPHGEDVLPSDERVRCEHVANYAAQLRQENQEKFKRVFSQLSSRIDPAELPKHVEEVLERIKAAYKAVIEASTRQQVTEVTGSE